MLLYALIREEIQMSKTQNKSRKDDERASKGGTRKSYNRKPNKGGQPRKDSSSKRENLDNARVDRVERDIEEGKLKPGANDITDFNRNPELLTAACRYPFAAILGNPFEGTGNTVPGVMSMVWQPNFNTGSDGSALNKAFQQMYSFVVHKNSRNYKYEYTDLAMYILAGAEVFSAISDAVRAYGTVKLYPEPNRYMCDGVLQTMGWDGRDLRNNLNQMYFDILNLINMSKNIWIPTTVPLITRWIKRNASLYTDATGTRSQTYVYVRDSYFMLSETASTTGTALVPALISNVDAGESDLTRPFKRTTYNTPVTSFAAYTKQTLHQFKWQDFYNMVVNMINHLVASQDRGMIYGDILNAYGPEKIYAFPPVSLDYACVPEYNAEILMQMENITVTNCAQVVGLYQTNANVNNRLIQVWAERTYEDDNTWYGAPDVQIMNVHYPAQPTPEDVMLMTRMKSGPLTKTSDAYSVTSTGSLHDSANWYFGKVSVNIEGDYNEGSFKPSQTNDLLIPYTAGTELPTGMFYTVWQNNAAGGTFSTKEVNQYAPCVMNNSNYAPRTAQLLSEEWWRIQAFDWHPFFYYMASSQGEWNLIDAYGDFDNYTTINAQMLREMNDVALYSVLGIPHM